MLSARRILSKGIVFTNNRNNQKMNDIIIINNIRSFFNSVKLGESNTLKSAKKMLGLQHSETFTMRELRHAYFQAAKMCHPDLQKTSPDGKDLNDEFNTLTEAYELLQQKLQTGKIDDDYGITLQEEQNFRTACQDWLGVPAEVVEESKRCPIFRDWLQGKTDAAMLWNAFFALNGGLAPMLRPPSALIEGKPEDKRKGLNRRKKRK